MIFLGGLRGVSTEEEAMLVNREAFQAARAVAGAISAEGGLLVTVQDTGGDFGLSGRARAEAATKTAAEEWPKATARALDVERGGRGADEIAGLIAGELLAGGDEREVGLPASGGRVVIRTQAGAAPRGALAMDSASVVVATGGARGVTAVCLIELARTTRAKMALTGRSPLVDEPAATQGAVDEPGLTRALLGAMAAAGRRPTPAEVRGEAQKILASREVKATLRAIEAAGSPVLYLPADAQDAASVSGALAEVRRAPPITALVHGAGVLADKLLVRTVEQFDRVFGGGQGPTGCGRCCGRPRAIRCGRSSCSRRWRGGRATRARATTRRPTRCSTRWRRPRRAGALAAWCGR